MKTKLIYLWFILLALSIQSLVALAETPPNNEAEVKQHIKFTLGVGNVFRRAIDQAYARGCELGKIPTDPNALGLSKPEVYANRFVSRVKHDDFGRIIISFENIPELGLAAGQNMILEPIPEKGQRKLHWKISEESTVPRNLLPFDVTISGQPIFRPFVASTPLLVAFQNWHRAIMMGDYKAYLQLSMSPTGVGEEAQRKAFEELRSSMPSEFKISEPETLPTGALRFQALGCKDGLRRTAIIIATRENQTFRFLSTAWATPWDKTARDCPI